ncbi:hypothetical protein PVAP13_2KG143116 [Panicum virgatum]|uniref:Uncharacterized protein n=1 Tax=Panicum virgatum TaxID=38727 RepID=A0A8T0W0V0_PANVG|nr:hypothetical protein PVAP13_2KG143116 [Panicum virgatum]
MPPACSRAGAAAPARAPRGGAPPAPGESAPTSLRRGRARMAAWSPLARPSTCRRPGTPRSTWARRPSPSRSRRRTVRRAARMSTTGLAGTASSRPAAGTGRMAGVTARRGRTSSGPS